MCASEFESKFKALRNRLKSIRADDFIIKVISETRESEKYEPQELARSRPLPWILLILLKLAVEFCGENVDAKRHAEDDFRRLYNLTYDLEGEYSSYYIKQGRLSPFLFGLAHKQFMYQMRPGNNFLSRLFFLFLDRKSAPEMQTGFLEAYGIFLQDFVLIFLILYFYFRQRSDLKIFDIKALTKNLNYSDNEIDIFLKHVTVHIDSAKQMLLARKTKVKSYILQFGEPSPFIYRPILRVSDTDYIPISINIFEKSLENYITVLIKNSGDEELISNFAMRFEKYVGELLRCCDISYEDENQLLLRFKGKVVDYLISNGDVNIMIEAKSAILSDLAKARPDASIINNALEDSIIKAIIQGIELSSSIYITNNKALFYLIIVVTEDIYLGTPEEAWAEYFNSYITENYSELLETSKLDVQNIFIVSIRELENISRRVNKNYTLQVLLENAVRNNTDLSTRKMLLEMHLPSEIKSSNREFVENNLKRFDALLHAKFTTTVDELTHTS